MEERLVQNQPEKPTVEGLVDLESIGSLPDWPCIDFEDAMLAGGRPTSPQAVVESLPDAGGNEEAVARLSSGNCNDSVMQVEAPPSVPIAVMTEMSPITPMPLLPDLLHCDRCVEKTLIPHLR